MSDGAIEQYNGAASDLVTTKTNVVNQMTPILQISPDRGNAIRILNTVARGQSIGVPVYMKLKDANGDDLPVDTSLQWEFSPSNSDQRYKISRRLSNIAQYNNNTIAQQTDVDRIDTFKQVLTEPEFRGSSPVDFFQWTDIEDVYVSIKSSAQIDHSESKFEVEPSAVEGPFTRGV
ncbi:hypothetical protein [Halapricum desulfuricans]|uniref:VP7/VP16-like Major capsid protein n=1 Tax=Halapricum desulfuricans TaxID=2841257 RepID=A0A897N624_9EURY|nr:hypothetical protein [Halapricum desulfuricans]QSG06465.1 VP7/VP16-like Major capsid protein [Halapricum desulfuricans]